MIARVSEISVADARAEAIELKLAGRKGEDLIQARRLAAERGLTLGDAYPPYLEALKRKGGSPRTFSQYKSNWKLCLLPNANRPLAQITKHDLRSWHTSWGKRGPTTANKALALFRAIYNHAIRTTDGLPPNPAMAIDPFQERNSQPVLTWEALPEWLDLVDQLENPTRRAFWRFVLYSGLRKRDACTVRWDEVFEDRVHRPNPKGGRNKAFDLPLSSQLKAILADAREAHTVFMPNSPFVFPAARSVDGHIERTSEKTIPGVTPHVLRRTFATACVEAGLDPYTTKRLLNHTTARGDVTALYVKPSSDFLLESMGRVSDYIDRKSGKPAVP
ncbi:tyrosine-type recombinase/integrase [Oceanicaulis sp. UBA2681]|uniref:tyrosine-type recombinase/integrase n=1 Tax=Oceanicaulis sp. UBA2681 TaxID=1947007 RepID=UPI000ED1D4BF|nr:tyrosine-type recombinase/integrase [Oceanicaulis sp. UBA2681]HCR66529.1 hypothetical protein [Oceanicaulis sp.]